MTASELRIGNWVNTCSPNMPIMIPHIEAQVQAISFFEEISFLHTPTHEGFEMPSQHIMGIPLTEEWLLKFGFRKMNTGWLDNKSNPYWAKNAVLLLYTETPPENTYLGGYGLTYDVEGANKHLAAMFKWIKYVHQLQNLYFALTGEELTLSQTL